MGGPMHLVTFETQEDQKALVDSQRSLRWYRDQRNFNNKVATKWREIWLNVYRVPIDAWTYYNFHMIVCVFGKVISIDHSSFGHAKFIVHTYHLFKINCKMGLDVEEVRLTIFIWQGGSNMLTNALIKISNEKYSIKIQSSDDNGDDDDDDSNAVHGDPPQTSHILWKIR